MQRYDAVIVGAGFAGLYAIYRLRKLGLRVRAFEQAPDLGGTWYWNRYPGARCDIASIEYSYSFSDALQQEWTWKERFSSQTEILAYLNHVAERFDLRRDIQFDTRIGSAIFDEAADGWTVTTDRGETAEATYCVMATGCLSAAKVPDIPGLESFEGRWFHSARWPAGPVDFSGKRVAVIGTGSSGIQIIPEIARQANHLTVFQRTANFSVPARNRPITPDEARSVKQRYAELRERAVHSSNSLMDASPSRPAAADTPEARQAVYEERWSIGGAVAVNSAYNDLLRDPGSNETLAEFVRAKIRAIVKDPAVAELLTPRDHYIGTKRLCQDNGYYETFNRPNVTLVDLRSFPIEAFTPTGLKTARESYALDMVVFATGFDAITGPLRDIDIRGLGGRRLAEKWDEAPKAYLGFLSAGFPNMFMITGPGSPSVKGNNVMNIEQHVQFAGDCIARMQEQGFRRIDADEAAEAAWYEEVARAAERTLLTQVNSWYMGANIPGKIRVYLPYIGGNHTYRDLCRRVLENGFEGFRLS